VTSTVTQKTTKKPQKQTKNQRKITIQKPKRSKSNKESPTSEEHQKKIIRPIGQKKQTSED